MDNLEHINLDLERDQYAYNSEEDYLYPDGKKISCPEVTMRTAIKESLINVTSILFCLRRYRWEQKYIT